MNEQAKKAQREYQRRWRQEHPDKVRQYAERYWERKAQENNHTTETTSVIGNGGEQL